MAQFDKNNFKHIVNEIEQMEAMGENIWVPVGILEYMYDDNIGLIDKYFHSSRRNVDDLWNKLSPQDPLKIAYGEAQIRQLQKKFDKEKNF